MVISMMLQFQFWTNSNHTSKAIHNMNSYEKMLKKTLPFLIKGFPRNVFSNKFDLKKKFTKKHNNGFWVTFRSIK